MWIFVVLIFAVPSYIIGSWLAAIFVSRIAKLQDVRHAGSQNPGATNVARLGGRLWGTVTFVLDASKAIVAIQLALLIRYLLNSRYDLGISADLTEAVSGFFVILGHVIPVWHRFKGGKGVATYWGVLSAIQPYFAFIFGMLWVVIFLLARISSLASIAAVFLTCLSSLYYMEPLTAFSLLIASVLVVYRHKANIYRIIDGKERSFN